MLGDESEVVGEAVLGQVLDTARQTAMKAYLLGLRHATLDIELHIKDGETVHVIRARKLATLMKDVKLV